MNAASAVRLFDTLATGLFNAAVIAGLGAVALSAVVASV